MCGRPRQFGSALARPFLWMSSCALRGMLLVGSLLAMDSSLTSCVADGSCMKASTREWVAKSEEAFMAAEALNRRRGKPLWNVVSFHVQQTVEKYLRARLEEAGWSIPKTHDLLHLLNLVAAVEPLW